MAQYEAVSRQAINRQKTTLFFSKNTRADVKHNIRNLMGARIVEDCEKYLGLPMASEKKKNHKEGDGMERKVYFKSGKGSPNQDGSASNTNILHRHL